MTPANNTVTYFVAGRQLTVVQQNCFIHAFELLRQLFHLPLGLNANQLRFELNLKRSLRANKNKARLHPGPENKRENKSACAQDNKPVHKWQRLHSRTPRRLLTPLAFRMKHA